MKNRMGQTGHLDRLNRLPFGLDLSRRLNRAAPLADIRARARSRREHDHGASTKGPDHGRINDPVFFETSVRSIPANG
jgi:hypothetical protein